LEDQSSKKVLNQTIILEFQSEDGAVDFVMKILEWKHPDATIHTNINGKILEVQVTGRAAVSPREDVNKFYEKLVDSK